jgi:hypothetical protein
VDKYFITIWKILKKGTSIKYPDYSQKDDLLYYKGHLYIPHGEFRKDWMCQYHDHPMSGHPGRQVTQAAISKDYWWPNMRNYVKKYMEGCGYQRHKMNIHPTMPPMNLITSNTNRPFTQLSVDLITDLLMNNRCDSIMVIVNHGLSKGVIITPCTKSITAKGVAMIFIEKVFVQYRMYDKVISD